MKVDITFNEKCLTIGLMTVVPLSTFLLPKINIILQTIIIVTYVYLLAKDRPTLIYAICAKLPRDVV